MMIVLDTAVFAPVLLILLTPLLRLSNPFWYADMQIMKSKSNSKGGVLNLLQFDFE